MSGTATMGWHAVIVDAFRADLSGLACLQDKASRRRMRMLRSERASLDVVFHSMMEDFALFDSIHECADIVAFSLRTLAECRSRYVRRATAALRALQSAWAVCDRTDLLDLPPHVLALSASLMDGPDEAGILRDALMDAGQDDAAGFAADLIGFMKIAQEA